jgi:hypothetical protein
LSRVNLVNVGIAAKSGREQASLFDYPVIVW